MGFDTISNVSTYSVYLWITFLLSITVSLAVPPILKKGRKKRELKLLKRVIQTQGKRII